MDEPDRRPAPAGHGPGARRPTRDELQAAYGRLVPDLVRPGLAAVLCGINPSLWSGAVGLHFATPGNRLWPTLHASGWTPRRLRPDETGALLDAGCGVTNLIASVERLYGAGRSRGAVAAPARYKRGVTGRFGAASGRAS
jgi:TDG/mug DNA glycosylase family protein